MRNKKAKKIRKEIYGDYADIRRYRRLQTGQIVCAGLRAEYKQAKKK